MDTVRTIMAAWARYEMPVEEAMLRLGVVECELLAGDWTTAELVELNQAQNALDAEFDDPTEHTYLYEPVDILEEADCA